MEFSCDSCLLRLFSTVCWRKPSSTRPFVFFRVNCCGEVDFRLSLSFIKVFRYTYCVQLAPSMF